MDATARAIKFRTWHQRQIVGRGADGGFERWPEARPAGAAVIFRVGGEQRQLAARAGESPLALLAIERARARNLGAVQAQHIVLRFCQDAPPFAVGLLNLERLPGAGVVAVCEPASPR